MKRNAVLYFAIKNKMDYLIFLDDDEYPVAAFQINDCLAWKGQEVLASHINNVKDVDMTSGHHCGYISPIPFVNFNEKLTENEFKMFIQAISNDIINWTTVQEKMKAGGVTYADFELIRKGETEVVQNIGGMKFISGANLGLNLRNPKRSFPFYNPPMARGEDTFLSTCITGCNVRKIPIYTFHDAYTNYEHLLLGVLPNKLKAMKTDSGAITKRFLRAAIGWIRYKPLLMYITQRGTYEDDIIKIKKDLTTVIPHICNFFGSNEFNSILTELDFYDSNVKKHFHDFENTKLAWSQVLNFLSA